MRCSNSVFTPFHLRKQWCIGCDFLLVRSEKGAGKRWVCNLQQRLAGSGTTNKRRKRPRGPGKDGTMYSAWLPVGKGTYVKTGAVEALLGRLWYCFCAGSPAAGQPERAERTPRTHRPDSKLILGFHNCNEGSRVSKRYWTQCHRCFSEFTTLSTGEKM